MRLGAKLARVFSYSLLILVGVWLSGCAGYAGRIAEPRRYFDQGQYDLAASRLEVLTERNDNDKLLYLMDLGLVYHAAKKYPEAIKAFHAAEKLAAEKDYTSVTQEVGSVITNDDALFYKGEDFEKILIHVYLAMDYALMGKFDEALVEARRVNRKLDMLISQGQIPYERNAFAKYLSGVLFESQGDWNGAFVDYRQLRKWNPQSPLLGNALLRVADKLQASQELEEFKKAYPEEKQYRLDKTHGEVVVFVEQGKSPVKVPSPQMVLVPVFSKRSFRKQNVVVRDATDASRVCQSKTLFDVEETAIRELNSKLAGMIAKKVAGTIAKHAIGEGVAKASDNKLAGVLTTLFLRATDKADLRSWTTLPATLQIARLALPAGRRDIVLDMVDPSGGRTPAVARWTGVEVKAGKITFLGFRAPD
jgi:uncharacterized protein